LQELLEGAEVEASYYWRDPGSNLLLKARPDLVNKKKRILLDFKTTTDASFNSFRRSIANFSYDIQSAFYLDGVNAALGTDFNRFIFVAVEKQAPYEIALYELDEASIDVGRDLYKQGIKKLKSNEHR
jgi:exodeoxyribonuclease VIII